MVVANYLDTKKLPNFQYCSMHLHELRYEACQICPGHQVESMDVVKWQRSSEAVP